MRIEEITPVKLYHGTSKDHLSEIMKDGLNPFKSKSSLPAIFLTDSKHTALNYSIMHYGWDKSVVLEINPDMLDKTKLGPDNYELAYSLEEMSPRSLKELGYRKNVKWNEVSWEDSMTICGQVAYHAVIPPEAILPTKINERSEVFPYKDYTGNEIDLRLTWNPTIEQAKNLIDRSADKTLRLQVIDDNNIVVWDAHYVEHKDVLEFLGKDLKDYPDRSTKMFLRKQDHLRDYEISYKAKFSPNIKIRKFIENGFVPSLN